MASLYPPLGTTHIVGGSSSVRFAAVPQDGLQGDFTLEIWSNISGEWREHTLEEQQSTSGNIHVAYVEIHEPARAKTFEYTYRIRYASGHIEWLSKAGGNDNGYIVCSGDAESDGTPAIPFDGADSRLNVVDGAVNAQGITTKRIIASLSEGAEGEVESFYLGGPNDSYAGLDIERTKPTWFTPRTFTSLTDISSQHDAQLVVFRTLDGIVALFPLSTASASCTIRGSTDGQPGVWLRAERDTSSSAVAQAVLASGPEGKLLEVIEACIAEAKAILAKESIKLTNGIHEAGDQYQVLNGIHEAGDQMWSLRESAKLVFCTWNSLGQDYHLSGVFERLSALQAGKTLNKYEAVLLDDGWQDVGVIDGTDLRALRSFGTREGWMDAPDLKNQQSPNLASIRRKDSGFMHSRVTSQESIDLNSNTLKQAVDAIKIRYSDIKHVGTWLTLEGYWNGLHPESEISREYDLVRFGKREPLSQYPYPPEKEGIYLPALSELDRFWNDYFTTLHDAGVDFVKIDDQAEVEYFVGEGVAEHRAALARSARQAAIRVFGAGNLINCMAHSARNYCEFLSSRSEPKNSFRSSDDFFPFETESHRFHIAFNATTAFLHRFLSVTPDADMFTSHHELADYHAQLRAFFSAPIYLTDNQEPNLSIVAKLGGQGKDGQFALLKSETSQAVKLANSAFQDITGEGEGPALKIGLPVAGGALLGVWNCRGGKAATSDFLTYRDIADAIGSSKTQGSDYVLLLDAEKGATHDLKSFDATAERKNTHLSSQTIVPLRLAGETCRRFVVASVTSFGDDRLAVFGLIDKYASLCAIKSISQETYSEKPQVQQNANNSQPKANSVPAVTTELIPSGSNASHMDTQEAKPAKDPETTSMQSVARLSTHELTGSRLWTLLFFFRTELRNIRRSFFRDFWSSPFWTMYRELRAVFGGETTIPVEAVPASRDNAGTSYGTFEDDNIVPEEASSSIPAAQEVSPEQDDLPGQNAAEELSTPQMDAMTREELVVKLKASGKLAWKVAAGPQDGYRVTIEHQDVEQRFLSSIGQTTTLDMDAWVMEHPQSSTDGGSSWRVALSRF